MATKSGAKSPKAKRPRTAALRADHRDDQIVLEFKFPGSRKRQSRAERFWSKVDKSAGPDACWPWQSSTMQSNGYGQFFDTHPETGKPTMRTAHRVAWELHNGRSVPRGRLILHARECTSRRCCNPAHLRTGTQAENIADAVSLKTVGRRKLNRGSVLELVALKRQHSVENWVLADRYSVTVECIRAVLSGKTWSKVTGIMPGTRSPNCGRPKASKLKVAA